MVSDPMVDEILHALFSFHSIGIDYIIVTTQITHICLKYAFT